MASFHIRKMHPGEEEHIAKMSILGFRSIFEWAVGEENLEAVIAIETEALKHATTEYHQRTLVALVDGEHAGTCTLKRKNDREPDDVNLGFLCSRLGICGTIALCCMGCAGYVTQANIPDDTICFLDRICVRSSYRKRGIGGSLLDAAEKEARRQGCEKLFLWVEANNPAKNFYEKRQYVVVEERDGICFSYCATGQRYFFRMEKNLVVNISHSTVK